MFTCRDGEGGELSGQASKMLYKPLSAVYITSYKGSLNQSDCWKLFVHLWNYSNVGYKTASKCLLCQTGQEKITTKLLAQLERSKLRVVPLLLYPLCVTWKKTMRKKCPRELLRVRSMHPARPQDFTRPFFLMVFFCVVHDGPSEGGTTRSLERIRLGVLWSGQFPQSCTVCCTLVPEVSFLRRSSDGKKTPLSVGDGHCKMIVQTELGTAG